MVMYTQKGKGFTVIELAVVITVIAILGVVGYIGYSTWRDRVAETELRSDLGSVNAAMESARNWGKNYPEIASGATFDGSESTKEVFTQSENVVLTYMRGDRKFFCIQAESSAKPGLILHINSKDGSSEPEEGACAENDGVVTTFLGDGEPNSCKNGVGLSASTYVPTGITVSDDGSLYTADAVCNIIRKITPEGAISTVAGSIDNGRHQDGIGSSARFNQPRGLAFGPNGNLYIADLMNHRVRVMTPAGEVTTLAGNGVAGNADGNGTNAQFNQPYDITVGPDNVVYVADSYNNRIRKITQEGMVSTLAGSNAGYSDGNSTTALFQRPFGIAITSDGSKLYVADTSNHRIREINPLTGHTTTLAGSGIAGHLDGTGTAARFDNPRYLALSKAGTLYFSDGFSKVRMVTPDGVATTLAGSTYGYKDGVGTEAEFHSPAGIVVTQDWKVYVTDASNKRIRLIQ